MTRIVCDTCRYFGGERVKGAHGSCRIDAPTISSASVPGRNDWLGQWPWVSVDDWCGRYASDKDRTSMAERVVIGQETIV